MITEVEPVARKKDSESSEYTFESFYEQHRGIVMKHAFLYANSYELPHQIEDLVQEGIIGIIQATSKYDVSKGPNSSPYFWYAIRNRMSEYASQNAFVLNPKDNTSLRAKEIQIQSETFWAENGRYPTDDELITDFGFTEGEIRATKVYQGIRNLKPVSWNDTLSSSNDLTYEETTADSQAVDPLGFVIAKEEQIVISKKVRRSLSFLPPDVYANLVKTVENNSDLMDLVRSMNDADQKNRLLEILSAEKNSEWHSVALRMLYKNDLEAIEKIDSPRKLFGTDPLFRYTLIDWAKSHVWGRLSPAERVYLDIVQNNDGSVVEGNPAGKIECSLKNVFSLWSRRNEKNIDAEVADIRLLTIPNSRLAEWARTQPIVWERLSDEEKIVSIMYLEGNSHPALSFKRMEQLLSRKDIFELSLSTQKKLSSFYVQLHEE